MLISYPEMMITIQTNFIYLVFLNWWEIQKEILYQTPRDSASAQRIHDLSSNYTVPINQITIRNTIQFYSRIVRKRKAQDIKLTELYSAVIESYEYK